MTEQNDKQADTGREQADRARPIPESYWVIPSKLLAGEYPGARDADVAKRKVQRVLGAGVTCFIDLTEQNGLLRPYWPDVQQAASRSEIAVEYQHWPIPDMDVPTRAYMTNIIAAIDQALATNQVVYLHCWGGIGRTGTVVACYLIEHGLDARAALDRIALLRRGTPDSYRLSPETYEQHAFVLAWGSEAGVQ